MTDVEGEITALIEGMHRLIEEGRHEAVREAATRLEELTRGYAAGDLDTLAAVLDLLGKVYAAIGDTVAAAQHFHEELEIHDRLGAGDAEQLERLTRLAILYGDAGNAHESVPFCRRALAVRRAARDGDAEDLRANIRYLAMMEERVANLAEAEALYRELIALVERDLGGDVAELAAYKAELANVLLQRGALAEAENLAAASLERDRRIEGGDPLQTAMIAAILGLVYDRIGQPARSLPLFEECLRIRRDALPETHSDLADAYNNMGLAYVGLGDFAEAERHLVRAEKLLAMAEDAGKTFSLVLARINLADVFRQSGKLADAEAYARPAVDGAVAFFGEDHPHTAGALNVLAMVCQATDRYDEALPLMQRVQRIRRLHAPDGSVEEVSAANNLGVLQLSRGTYSDAIATLTKAHERAVAAIGSDHPLTAFTLDNLAEAYRQCGEPERGLPLAEEGLAIRRRVQGESHPDFAHSLSTMAKLLIDMRRYADAEPLLLRAVELERETLGAAHPRYAVELSNLGSLYKETGRLERADEIYREALEVTKAALGPRHGQVATVVGNLANVRSEMGDVAGALELAREALDIDREAFGEDHPKTAVSLHNLAYFLVESGRYREAAPLSVQALDIARRALGPRHPEYASVLSKAADIETEMGNYRRAERLLLEELEIQRGNVGEQHPRIAHILTMLADLYRQSGKLPEAAETIARSIEIQRAAGRTNGDRYAAALSNQALILMAQGEYSRARENLLQTMEIESRIFPDDHPEHALMLMNLGTLYRETGRLTEAAELYVRGVDILRRAGGRNPRLGVALNNLALVRAAQGDVNEAERLLAESRDIKREMLGDAGPDFALALNNLAVVYSDTGADTNARRLLEQALSIARTTLDEPHPMIALLLSTLATIHVRHEEYEPAERLLRESLEMRRRIFGGAHPEIARTLSNIGALHLYRDELDDAERSTLEALEMFRRFLPEEHPEIARALNNLAETVRRRGDFAAAEEHHRRALELWRRALGDEHPGLTLSLLNLAGVIAARGRPGEALDVMLQLERINDLAIGRTLPGLPESRSMAWLESIRVSTDAFLSLVFGELRASPAALRHAFDLVLRRKAIAFEVLAFQSRSARMQEERIAAPMRELREQRRRLAEESLVDASLEGAAAHRQKVEALQVVIEELEAQLAQSVPAVGLDRRLQSANRTAVAASLGADEALVEFVRFDFADFAAIAPRKMSESARYAAFVVRGERPDDVHAIDLGDAAAIDHNIDELRHSIEHRASYGGGSALRVRVLDPILRAAPDCRRLFIAPDGALHRLPFEALPGPSGGYVLDTHHISYVVAGRDLVEPASGRTARSPGPPLVAAAPDFDLSADGAKPHRTRPFKPLPGAEDEGIEIADTLGVRPLLGREVLKQ
ncbi:MAG TPA: tetratricopeptide repeat protein, partial [Thermoanaerobaculia bacterium]|nr:tetratricopeptide repeat protein [Thermoanaerobaculia bacterium]